MEHTGGRIPQQRLLGQFSSGPPSLTPMSILTMPHSPSNTAAHAKMPPNVYSAFDHQRVGSFRSRLKKQNPIFCAESFEPASMNVSVPVEVERSNVNINRDILSPPQPQIQLQPVIKRNVSPPNGKVSGATEMSGNRSLTPINKSMIASIAAPSSAGSSNQVHSSVVVEINNTAPNPPNKNNILPSDTANSTYTAFEANMPPIKLKQHPKKFWRIGGNPGSSSRSGSGNVSGGSSSCTSSRGSKSYSSRDSKDDEGAYKDNTNGARYLSVTQIKE